MIAVIFVALLGLGSLGGASAEDVATAPTAEECALRQDVEQDGEACINALQVKASQQEVQSHVPAEVSLRENSTENSTHKAADGTDQVPSQPNGGYPCWKQWRTTTCNGMISAGTTGANDLQTGAYNCAQNPACAAVYMSIVPVSNYIQPYKYYMCTMAGYSYDTYTSYVWTKGYTVTSTWWTGQNPAGVRCPPPEELR
jgi:hypothetical protein